MAQIYDSGNVAGGVAVPAVMVGTSGLKNVAIALINFGGTATRNLTARLFFGGFAVTGSLVLSSAAAGTNRLAVLGPGSAANAGLNVDAPYSGALPEKIELSIPAAGAGGVQFVVWGDPIQAAQ